MLASGLRKARLAAGIVGYLRDPVEPERALADVRARVERRSETFLANAETAIFGDPRSPHLKLLRWAGWDHAGLGSSVESIGLTDTLSALRDQGVRTSLEEFKGREPIRRGDLLIQPGESRFDNPLLRRRGLRAATSGTSSGSSTEVPYDWSLLREEAALECLLFESHGLLGTPCALLLPALPSISGIHNLLVHLRFRSVPERWFSQIPVRRRDAVTLRSIRSAARLAGLRAALPEQTGLGDAELVARWMVSARRRAGGAVLKTFATSAVRVAEAALRLGLELDGCVVFAGGEALTERRHRFIASTGARVFARYVATETGWIGGACPHGGSPDAMHLYSDRLAVIPREPDADGASPLLFTTVSPHAGTVLLNTDIGDAGRLGVRDCSCPLGQAGLDVELSGVHGHDKISAEGMTVPHAILSGVLDELIDAAGGSPDACQLREAEDPQGGSRLVIVLAPHVPIGDAELVDGLLAGLPAHGFGAELAARMWRENGTIEVRREQPVVSRGAKQTAVVRGT